jgi:hypothetical protein
LNDKEPLGNQKKNILDREESEVCLKDREKVV